MFKKKKEKENNNKESILKNCIELVPIRTYDDNLNAFICNGGTYLDILKINAKDIDNMSEDEIKLEFINLIKIYKVIGIDLKFISMNFPLNTAIQRSLLEIYKERISDSVRAKWIDRQIDELNRADKGILTRDFYMMYFGENENDFIKNKELVSKFTRSGNTKLVKTLSKTEKIKIISKLANMNTLEDISREEDIEPDIIKLGKEKQDFDQNLFSRIQPKGGVSFKDPSYIRFGDGYVRCLHIYALPTYISEFWLIRLFNTPNCICTYDISTKDINVVKKNINKSIQEEDARARYAKNHQEAYDSTKRKAELEMLFDDISRLGEVIKLCDFRIYVKAKTILELEELSEEIMKNLESDGFMSTTFLNEQKSEWTSVFESYAKSHKKPFKLNGLTLTSEQLAMGYPFNYSQLLDEEGVLLGFTKTGGVILFDPFCKTEKRKHYNSIVCGDMGSGKSVLLKKLFKHQASIGSYVRVFDVSGEFRKLTQEFGGKIIDCSSEQGMLNPLEILKADEDDKISYSNHITKLQSFFKCIVPSMGDDLKQELANHLGRFYEIYSLTPAEGRTITGRDPGDYPILSNFKIYLEKSIESMSVKDKEAETDVETGLNIDKAKILNNLLSVVDNLTSNYGYMFDGHTTIKNITEEKIVCFDISKIKELKDQFTAQMQNLVSLCWDNAVNNGEKMKEIWGETETDDLNSEDITKFIVLIDESHRWVNTSMPQILDMLIRYMREARKYFAGLVLASQSVRDFMPESTGEGLEKITHLFELSQYKFMFKQDSSAKEHIKNKFGFGLTESQVERIPFLGVGENILSISGDTSIEFKVWLDMEYEEKLFAGGR